MVVVVCVVTSTAGAATASGVQAISGDAAEADAVAADIDTATVGAGDRSAQVDVDVEEPETGDDFLTAFRELSERESLSAYSEFEVIRTQAIVAVQSGEFSDAKRTRMRAVLRTLVRFDAAYTAAQEGSLDTSLESATATREAVSTLDASGGAVYGSLAGVALDRFFESLGERFEERARSDGVSTPARIDDLQRAGQAYRESGASDRFAEISVEAEQLQSAWERDQQEINESMATTQQFIERCGDACASPVSTVTTHTIGVFGLYTDARTASAESSEAVRIADANGLSDRTAELQTVAEDASSTLLSLAIGSAVVLFAYALVLAIPTMFVASRISAWARDRRAADVGSILSPMPREVYTDGGE